MKYRAVKLNSGRYVTFASDSFFKSKEIADFVKVNFLMSVSDSF